MADGEMFPVDILSVCPMELTVLRDLGGQPSCQPSQKLGGTDTPGLPRNAGGVSSGTKSSA